MTDPFRPWFTLAFDSLRANDPECRPLNLKTYFSAPATALEPIRRLRRLSAANAVQVLYYFWEKRCFFISLRRSASSMFSLVFYSLISFNLPRRNRIGLSREGMIVLERCPP